MNTSKIVYVKNDEYFLYDGKNLTPCNASESKKYYTSALASPFSLYVYSQKLPSSLNDEQIGIKMDISMYEDGGAEEEHEYTTDFTRNNLPSEDNDLVDLFGLSDEHAKTLYGHVAEQTKAIDLISPSIAIYKTLYTKETENLTDIYIYLGDEEAYGVLYLNGNFVAHRNLEALTRLSIQCNLDLVSLKNMLKKQGVSESLYKEEQYPVLDTIQNVLSRSVERVAHTVNHKRGLFNFDEIDRIFIDFEGSSIPGFESIFAAYELHVSKVLPIQIPQNQDPKQNHDVICAKYIYDVANGKYKGVNISPFKRQLPLHKKPAGLFILVGLLSALVVFIAFNVLDFFIEQKNDQISQVQIQIKKAAASSKLAINHLKDLNEQYKLLNEQYKNIENEGTSLEKAQKEAPSIVAFAIKRQALIDDSLMGLSQNGLGVTKLDQNGSNSLHLSIVTTPDKQEKIANFIDFMTKRGYIHSKTDQIIKKNGLYESIVEIAR